MSGQPTWGWVPTRRELAIVLAAGLLGTVAGLATRPDRSLRRATVSEIESVQLERREGTGRTATTEASTTGDPPRSSSSTASSSSSSSSTAYSTDSAASPAAGARLFSSSVAVEPDAISAGPTTFADDEAVLAASTRSDGLSPGSMSTTQAAAAPARLSVAVLGLFDAEVVPVGVDRDGGLEVPAAHQAGWFRDANRVGGQGTVVLAAHVAYGGRPGLFARLTELAPGDRVVLSHTDAVISQWEVTSVGSTAKAALPVPELFRTDGPPALVLITCGGTIDPVRGRYGDNVIVMAQPIA